MASATLETSWKDPGCFQEPSRKDPGKHGEIAKKGTFPPGIPPGNFQEGYPDIHSSFLPASFLDTSWITCAHPGRMLEDRPRNILFAWKLPGRLQLSWKLPGGSGSSWIWILRIHLETSRKHPGRIQLAWKVPGRGYMEISCSPGSFLATARKLPGK